MSRLEDRLILNRYIFNLLGVESFEELKTLLRLIEEGPNDDGQSNFYGRIVLQPELKLSREKLAEYDRRIIVFESRLAAVRHEFKRFRYFQYLSLLFTEIYLDLLTADPTGLLDELNGFLDEVKKNDPEVIDIPTFNIDDLRRIAFFMATGSGKTLLLHINIWQILHYLNHGMHPEVLVRRVDGRREFDNILLITPNEGLSGQHIEELHLSGLNAGLFIEDPHGHKDLFGVKVKVIEIHKLAEKASKDGVGVVLDELGTSNLILVDEGHKGTGSEARVWKNRQQKLSQDGFLMEYSATFAQAIGAAGAQARQALMNEYGKAILFDYSYAYFYSDGYGKNFNVLNLSHAHSDQAYELLVGGLLTFYNQLNLYIKDEIAYQPYNIEKPLWVMLGSSVNAMYTRDGRRRSDVAEIVAFLKRFVEQNDWAIAVVNRILEGNSGFKDSETGQDLFATHIKKFRRRKPKSLYKAILKDVFHGVGALEVWELKNTDGELALRLSTTDGKGSPYFGVINIGDVSTFRKHLKEKFQIEVQEDRFAGSLFEQVNRRDSKINILIGAKKFIEGWSSWRVSSMGLLNVGKGEGSQVIQLFGRGVRLKGKNMTLMRTDALPDSTQEERKLIQFLETLYIFGWNANYIRTFREMLEQEDIGRDFTIKVKHKHPWPKDELPIPQKKTGFDLSAFTWTMQDNGPNVILDMTPKITEYSGDGKYVSLKKGKADWVTEINFKKDKFIELLDIDELYIELITYKNSRGFNNVFIPRETVGQVLKHRCKAILPSDDTKNPFLIQESATQLIKKYLERFLRRKEREAEFDNVEPAWLEPDERVTQQYHLSVKHGRFLQQVENLLTTSLAEVDAAEPIPRFYLDWHLFSPLLTEGGKEWKKTVSVRPSALVKSETELVRNIKTFWKSNYKKPPFNNFKIYLLRNLPKSGIGLFHRSGFYPDFILWLKNLTTGWVHVRFLDPHGLHHGGLAGSNDKFAALSKLKAISDLDEFKIKKISLDGYALSKTSIELIPDANGRDWSDLENEYPLIQQQDDYCRRLFMTP